RQLAGQSRDPRGMPARAWILRLESIGQAEQALKDRALQASIGTLQVDCVLQRLLVTVAETLVGLPQLLFASPGGFGRALEIARVGQCLGERYLGGHVGTSGTSDRTSVSSASGEKGLVRYSSAPAAMPRARSSAWAAALSMTIRM